MGWAGALGAHSWPCWSAVPAPSPRAPDSGPPGCGLSGSLEGVKRGAGFL